jgi:hypothetical protein
MQEVWTLTKPMLVTIINTSGEPAPVKARGIRVIEQVGFPEDGLQKVFITGYIGADDESNQIYDMQFDRGQADQKPVMVHVQVKNILGKSQYGRVRRLKEEPNVEG